MPDFGLANSAKPLPSAELNAGGTSTSEVQFTTASALGQVAAGQPLVCPLPGSNVLKNRPFKVRVGGRVTCASGTSSNFTGIVYVGTSATIASNVAIATTGALATRSNVGFWTLDIDLAYSGDNNNIFGRYTGFVNHETVVASAVITSTAQLTTLASESSNNGLTVTGTFSTGTAGNKAYVDYFEVIAQ